MQQHNLQGKKVAILVTDKFEQIELTEPRNALNEAGAQTLIVSPAEGEVQGVHGDEKADKFPVDVTLDNAKADDFDALLLPGGTKNSDKLRMIEKATGFVRSFDEQNKPIAMICHAPWTPISAGIVNGRTLTSYESLKDDIRNAGGHWVNAEVVVDRNWVSSRKPSDLEAFNREMVRVFSEWEQTRKKQLGMAA